MYHKVITRDTSPESLDATGRQVLSIITPNTRNLDACLEIIYADEMEDLSEAARELCADHGITEEIIADYSIGDYLERQMLDYRTLRASDGRIIEIRLLVGFGGPNIWEHITADGDCETIVSWWGTYGRDSTNHDLYALMFEYLSEVIECL